MKPVEKLHYALGEIAYAMVWSGDKIRNEEIEEFMDTIVMELDNNNHDFDLLRTMFNSITGDKKDAETTYREAIIDIKANSKYLHPELKKSFVKALERVEVAYAPFTLMCDRSYVDRFKQDLSSVQGSLVYMGSIFLN